MKFKGRSLQVIFRGVGVPLPEPQIPPCVEQSPSLGSGRVGTRHPRGLWHTHRGGAVGKHAILAAFFNETSHIRLGAK